MANFCMNCGTKVQPSSKFCILCGTALVPSQPGAQPPPPPPQPGAQLPPLPPQYAPPPAQQARPQYEQPQQQAQYAQPQGGGVMFTDRQRVLAQAPDALNRPDRPWTVTVVGDSLVARWKWMDATFFSPHEVTDETRQFSFTVTLDDKGKWKELDKTENKAAGVKMSGGKLSFGGSSNSFAGKTNQKSFQFGLGKDNQSGQAGLVGFKFDTTAVKQPIRDYLTACGWKKAGLFG